MLYNIFIDRTALTITLRPHQDRILDRMLAYNKGQIIVPTGGGKTLTMIVDTQRRHDVINNGTTTVVVAPRILLAEQLCSEFLEVVDTANTHIMHVHSGETHHYSSTKADKIHVFANTARTAGENVIIFTTYNSLQRIVVQILRSILSTLTRHTTVFSDTFFLLLSFSVPMLLAAIFILPRRNIL